MSAYVSGFGLPADMIFDVDRTHRLLTNKWFFVGTRGDVPQPRDYFRFDLLDEQYFLVHGSDGVIRCLVNRCAHQSARLVADDTGACAASIVCPNHQWTYHLETGKVRSATGMGRSFARSAASARFSLMQVSVREVAGMVFACLAPDPDPVDIDEIVTILAPYTDPFALGEAGYRLAHHQREVIDANWLLVMINNRECCHCHANHRRLTKLFDPSSFNGARSNDYEELLGAAATRWTALGLAWEEQAFQPNDCCRVARYPLRAGYQSITFDGEPGCHKLIGPFAEHEGSTLSVWFNPNAWIHITSDHIATNWVLPLDGERCVLYSSWIVRADAEEGVDYDVDHLANVWRVTNAEDVGLCRSMTSGAKSSYYRPGPFSADEQFCTQFCDWFVRHSN